jgi:hypothetical protein
MFSYFTEFISRFNNNLILLMVDDFAYRRLDMYGEL